MKVAIEEVNSIKRKLTVELPEDDARQVRNKHLDAYVRKARLKGFRQGKAPRTLVAKIYADDLKREVLEELVSQAMPEALTEHKLAPVGMPTLETVEYEEGSPFKFTVMVELKPEFTTPEWRGLELQKANSQVTSEMVDKKLEELRLSLSTVKKVEEDRPLVKGDLANISYRGFDGEVEVEELKAGPINVELGSDRLTPEFEEGLAGMRVGESKDIPVSLPGDMENKNLAGRNLVMRTTVNEIKKRELPALDDELAKDLGIDGVETLAGLRDKIKADLDKAVEDQVEQAFNQQLTHLLAKSVKIDLPSAMVDREVTNRIEAMRNNFGRNGLNFKKMGIDVGMLRQRFQPQAEVSVTAALVLDQIGRDNNISVSDEDMEKELVVMSEEYGQPVEVLRDYYQSRDLMNNLREGLRISKTLDLIKAQAKVVEVEKIDPVLLGQEPPVTAAPDTAAPDTDAPAL